MQEEGLTNESRLLLHKHVAWLESYRGIATLSACDVGIFERNIMSFLLKYQCVSTQQLGGSGEMMVRDHLLNTCTPGSILQNTLVNHWQMICSIISSASQICISKQTVEVHF